MVWLNRAQIWTEIPYRVVRFGQCWSIQPRWSKIGNRVGDILAELAKLIRPLKDFGRVSQNWRIFNSVANLKISVEQVIQPKLTKVRSYSLFFSFFRSLTFSQHSLQLVWVCIVFCVSFIWKQGILALSVSSLMLDAFLPWIPQISITFKQPGLTAFISHPW